MEPHHPAGQPHGAPVHRIGVPTPIDARTDLPDLPIARPIGGGDASAPLVPIGRPLGTGGGASVTVADGSSDVVPAPTPPTPAGPVAGQAEPQDLRVAELQRFTWTIASELTSGMLANPSRANATVKDAMALFDHLLSEMRTYIRLTEGTDDDVVFDAQRQRRQDHSNWFRDAASAPGRPHGQPSVQVPGAPHAQHQPQPQMGPVEARMPSKPAPSEPIMIPRYHDLGMTGPMASEVHGAQPHPQPHGQPAALPPRPAREAGTAYSPGSMAGATPQPGSDDDMQVPRAA